MLRSLRQTSALVAFGAVLLAAPTPLFAANKEMIQLQAQVQQLQDALARLQQTNDERLGAMRELMQQSIDAVNKVSLNMDSVQRQVRVQAENSGKSVEQVSGQMQSLNDSVDELKARLGRIEKTLGDLQSSQQSINARMDSGGSAMSSPTASPLTDTQAPTGAGSKSVRPTASLPRAPIDAAPAASSGAPPVEDLYRTALGDFNGAKYPLAGSEFNDVIKYYPDSNYAGNAYFYLGEIEYKAGRYSTASKNYDKVVEQYPGNSKIPVAQLRKGESLIALKQTEAGARELKSLIQRYPNTQEATTARTKLSALGMGAAPRARSSEQ